MTTRKWTADNTEGFDHDDLAELNAAQEHLEARAPGIDPANIADAINNAFTPEADARELERRAARALGIAAVEAGLDQGAPKKPTPAA